MPNGLFREASFIVVTYGVNRKTSSQLTSRPVRVALNHPSPYVKVDSTALTFGPTILCEDVIVEMCACRAHGSDGPDP